MSSISSTSAPITTPTAATPNFTALVDAALAEVNGVTGGGGDGSIPPFVQQYLTATQQQGGPSATTGQRENEAPTKKSDGTQVGPGQVTDGSAYVANGAGGDGYRHLDRKRPPTTDVPPSKAPEVPGGLPPMKGSPTQGGEPPMKEPTPPTAETPPSKEPTPPGKVPTPPGKVPPTSDTPPSKEPTPPGTGTPPSKVDAPAPVQQSGPSAPIKYTVQRGDSLSEIAEGFEGITWQQIFTANKDQISNPDLIFPGQVLTIPSKDLEVAPFKYTPLFEPGIRGGPKRSPQPAPSTPPGKAPEKGPAPPTGEAPPKSEAPPKGEVPGKDGPGKDGPGKDTGKVPADPGPATTTPSSDAPPSQGTSSGELPTAPPAPTGEGLPPALPS
ncbi:MAG: LysM protein [Thermoleophilia bacterium]|nr:LysM protein [Thermoleophilia bacterium]